MKFRRPLSILGLIVTTLGILMIYNAFFPEISDRVTYMKFRKETNKCTHTEELRLIAEIIEKRLRHIQNPKNCSSRRKFACNIHVCGFGCEINTVTMCLMLGYALNRTVVVQPPLMPQLQPVGDQCVDNMVGTRAKFGADHDEFDIVDYDVRIHHELDFFPPAVPDDLADVMKRYHGNPYLWWTSVVSNFVFNPNQETIDFLLKEEVKLGLPKPIVGVHIRRSDKIQHEAKFHSVKRYMKHVEGWFRDTDKQLPGLERRVFLATDEPAVVNELTTRYPTYTVINNVNFSTVAKIKSNRHSDEGQLGFIHDLYMLSKCDFIVCTHTSNMCRLAVQLMNARRGNITNYAVSLDIDWFFWGANLNVKKASGDIPRAKMPIYEVV